MRSKFTFLAFMIGIPCNLIFYLLFFAALYLFIQESGGWIALLFFGFMWLLVFWGEFRTKLTRLHLTRTGFTIRRFGGLGPYKTYSYEELEGFRTGDVASHEHLYFIKNGRKVGKISAAYHKNYSELKRHISSNLKYLGEEYYSYLTEIKEIFMK